MLPPLPLPADNGLARVVGAGAAMEPQGSSSSTVPLAFTFSGFEAVLGAGAAMEPHRSKSSLAGLAVLLEPKLEPEITEISYYMSSGHDLES